MVSTFDLRTLLVQLAPGPQPAARLARLLGQSQGGVESALQQLRRGGFVEPAVPGQGSCSPGCGSCSQQSFCAGSQPAPPPLDLWRLTAKGNSRLRPDASLGKEAG